MIGDPCGLFLVIGPGVVNVDYTYCRLVRDPRAGYKQSLSVLEHAKKSVDGMVTKSSIMLGCGETDQQVLQALKGNCTFILRL